MGDARGARLSALPESRARRAPPQVLPALRALVRASRSLCIPLVLVLAFPLVVMLRSRK